MIKVLGPIGETAPVEYTTPRGKAHLCKVELTGIFSPFDSLGRGFRVQWAQNGRLNPEHERAIVKALLDQGWILPVLEAAKKHAEALRAEKRKKLEEEWAASPVAKALREKARDLKFMEVAPALKGQASMKKAAKDPQKEARRVLQKWAKDNHLGTDVPQVAVDKLTAVLVN